MDISVDYKNIPNYNNADKNVQDAVNANNSKELSENDSTIKARKAAGLEECTACASRRYVDGSNDPSVSFKTPQNISPEASFSEVSAHEQEHVSNERANAHKEGKEIVSQSVVLRTSICPECGRSYISGGTTTTVTKGSNEKDDFISKYNKIIADNTPSKFDRSI
jgi:hypothetical protein